MNELRRMAYLDAMGIDCYVSRTQLPGAAVTRRLAIVSRPVMTHATQAPVPDRDTVKAEALPVVSQAQREAVLRADFGLSARSGNVVNEPTREPVPQSNEALPRFKLSIIVAGDWLWLEDLGGMPLTTAQVQLVQSMAQALSLSGLNGRGNPGSAGTQAVGADVAHFEWPMHTNLQLDQGEDAARASVAAFVSRKLEQHRCRGLVLLGQACVRRVPLPQIKGVTVSTASSAEILANPLLKRQVWRDLQPLLGHS